MNKYVVFSCIALASCLSWDKSPTHHYSVYIDPTFPDNQKDIIKQSTSEWQSETGDFITLDTDGQEGQTDTINIYTDTSHELKADYGLSLAGITFWHGQEADIYVSIQLSDKSFHTTILHEMGHALGLQHSGDNTLMCKSIGCNANHITCADVKQLCEVWQEFDCVPDSMPACLTIK